MRSWRWLWLMSSVLLAGFVVGAQDSTPIPTPTSTLAPVFAPTNTPLPPTPTPTATALPNIASMLPGNSEAGQILLRARNDLEVLANATLGIVERPPGWSGTFDLQDPQMSLKARLDLEILADALATERPSAWSGIQATTEYGIARDIRHDLELLADAVVAPSVRPPNWIGDVPVMRCERSTQALALLLLSQANYIPTSSPASPTYCKDLSIELSLYTELNLLDAELLMRAAAVNAPAPLEAPSPYVPLNLANQTAAYLDRAAQQQAGIMPSGTLVRPVARSYAQFSRMMLVEGEGFLVFVDYQDTGLQTALFEQLADLATVQSTTFCAATWCSR